jgi:hypothetical protein
MKHNVTLSSRVFTTLEGFSTEIRVTNRCNQHWTLSPIALHARNEDDARRETDQIISNLINYYGR